MAGFKTINTLTSRVLLSLKYKTDCVLMSSRGNECQKSSKLYTVGLMIIFCVSSSCYCQNVRVQNHVCSTDYLPGNWCYPVISQTICFFQASLGFKFFLPQGNSAASNWQKVLWGVKTEAFKSDGYIIAENCYLVFMQ